jgi:hypothetical protein
MHEMFGNQYFLARNYIQAQKELEAALVHNPTSVSIKKKLVICHIQTETIDRAVDLFLDVITHDVHSIISTNPIFDNCPCPQLVYEMENSIATTNENQKNLALGMLWLYCDIIPSYRHFMSITRPDERVKRIIAQLQETLPSLQTTRYI